MNLVCLRRQNHRGAPRRYCRELVLRGRHFVEAPRHSFRHDIEQRDDV